MHTLLQAVLAGENRTGCGSCYPAAGLAVPPVPRAVPTACFAEHVLLIVRQPPLFSPRSLRPLLPLCCLTACPRPPASPPTATAPTTFSNLYFVELTENKWHKKKWKGPLQVQ